MMWLAGQTALPLPTGSGGFVLVRVLVLVLVLLLALAALSCLGALRWAHARRILLSRLEAGRIEPRAQEPAAPTRYDAAELEGLPAPVQRYFRAVLQDGQPLITAATIEMAGSFNLSSTGEQWKPFTSRQRVTTRRPGFLWDASIRMLPGVAVRVVDSYITGNGLLHAAILGLFTVAKLRGDGEIARGEFMRWFAEVPWYPTALLPSQGVRWQAVDDHSARATMADDPFNLTLLFRFNGDGLIGSFRAEARGSVVDGKMVTALSHEFAR